MHEHTQISVIGLDRKHLMSLASMLKLTAELRDNYRLVNPGDAWADVMFVNADEPSAMSALESFQHTNPSLTPIMVVSEKRQVEDEITIVRPLLFKRIVDALKKATTLHRPSGAVSKLVGASSDAKRILVVDDSFPVRKYMEAKIPLLSGSKVKLIFAASGEEAMAKVKEESPDLIFLDVMMPGVDGYKVCKWIKSIQPTTHVAMLTSKKSPFDRVRGTMSGCDDYLTKPPKDKKLAIILEKYR